MEVVVNQGSDAHDDIDNAPKDHTVDFEYRHGNLVLSSVGELAISGSGSRTMTRQAVDIVYDGEPVPWTGLSSLGVSVPVQDYTYHFERVETHGGDDWVIRGWQDSAALVDLGAGNDLFDGEAADELAIGGAGDDVLSGGGGNDILLGGDGRDVLRSGGNPSGGEIDVLLGMAGDDELVADHSALVQGGDGLDSLAGTEEPNGVIGYVGSVLDGGRDADSIRDSIFSDLVVGGEDPDAITLTTGADVYAFNRGDGRDVLALGEASELPARQGGGEFGEGDYGDGDYREGEGEYGNGDYGDGDEGRPGSSDLGTSRQVTLSLGGGIRQEDLRLRRRGTNLEVLIEEGDSITLRGWYDSASNPSVVLQMVAAAREDLDLASTDPIRNARVLHYDFNALVDAFDAAFENNEGDPLSMQFGWSVRDELFANEIARFDDRARGGDLAYQYALQGSLSGIGSAAAGRLIENEAFGVEDTTLTRLDAGPSGLQVGLVRLRGNDEPAEGDLRLHGTAGNDIIDGGVGDDALHGGDGNDRLSGLDGADALYGNGDADELDGGNGDDYLHGGWGDDELMGGAGHDRLHGSDGDDALAGGAGDDVLSGGSGDDVYRFSRGDGHDTIRTGTGRDSIHFGLGLGLDALWFSFSGQDLIVEVLGSEDRLVLENWLDTHDAGDDGVQNFLDAQGDALSGNQVFALAQAMGQIARPDANALVQPQSIRTLVARLLAGETVSGDYFLGGDNDDDLSGGAGNDYLYGGDGSDYLDGGAGDNVLYGGDGDDYLAAEAGNDRLYGGAGADELEVNGGDNELYGGDGDDYLAVYGEYGAGNNLLDGGAGNDEYDVALGLPGHQAIVEAGGTDELYLKYDGESLPEVHVSREGDDLVLSTGPDSSIAFDKWFVSAAHKVESIRLPPSNSINSTDWRFAIDMAELEALAERGGRLAELYPHYLQSTSSDDLLESGARDDAFEVSFGNGLAGGHDVIVDAGGNDELAITDVGADPSAVNLARDGDDLVFAMGDTSVTVAGWFNDPNRRIENVKLFSQGTTRIERRPNAFWSVPSIGAPADQFGGEIDVRVPATPIREWTGEELTALLLEPPNSAPVVGVALAAMEATEDAPWQFAVPSNAFADPDAGDTLTYTAQRADGSALPAWLTFDAATAMFAGTPGNDDVGTVAVEVIATDDEGESVSQVYSLTVENENDVPQVNLAPETVTTREDEPLNLSLPAGLFADVDDGDALSLSASLADSSPLPMWLSFDPATGTFSGTPANDDVGVLEVAVAATDLSGASATASFTLTV
ncbi:MAG: putative Ig domain-containing protein, partial [Gammaproteobacteria bacterium]